MLMRHNSCSLSGAGSKYLKKYCDVYARKLINAQTDGIASRDIWNEEQSILLSSHDLAQNPAYRWSWNIVDMSSTIMFGRNGPEFAD